MQWLCQADSEEFLAVFGRNTPPPRQDRNNNPEDAASRLELRQKPVHQFRFLTRVVAVLQEMLELANVGCGQFGRLTTQRQGVVDRLQHGDAIRDVNHAIHGQRNQRLDLTKIAGHHDGAGGQRSLELSPLRSDLRRRQRDARLQQMPKVHKESDATAAAEQLLATAQLLLQIASLGG